jgi:hypothetical protein
LDRYQELIEEVERKLDAVVRAKTAKENKENVQNAKNQSEGKSINNNKRILLIMHTRGSHSRRWF